MKKIVKKILGIAISLGLMLVTSTTAFATNVNVVENKGTSANLTDSSGGINTGDILCPAESIEEQLEGLSETQKRVALEKLTGSRNEELNITPYAVVWSDLPSFTMYKQNTNYYCTVASCKAAMQYLTGSSSSQETIAAALGTTTDGTIFSNAKKYLNSHQSSNTYIFKTSGASLSTMQNDFYSAIIIYDAPPLITVKLSTTDGWAYNTSGHTMCICGARGDRAYFRIADPYIKWANSGASMLYTKTASSIHKAISDRGNGYIY